MGTVDGILINYILKCEKLGIDVGCQGLELTDPNGTTVAITEFYQSNDGSVKLYLDTSESPQQWGLQVIIKRQFYTFTAPGPKRLTKCVMQPTDPTKQRGFNESIAVEIA